MKTISADEFVLCATNESSLYAEHCALARYTLLVPAIAANAWREQLIHRSMPVVMERCYPLERIVLNRVWPAAEQLRCYYEEHVQDCDAAA